LFIRVGYPAIKNLASLERRDNAPSGLAVVALSTSSGPERQ
jgi:hypothetical protein